jgi:hypothetical protein
MGKEISFQWDCHQALSKSFYGWKMETCTGSYLKKGLYQLAYADSPNDSQEKNELYDFTIRFITFFRESYKMFQQKANFRSRLDSMLLKSYRRMKRKRNEILDTQSLFHVDSSTDYYSILAPFEHSIRSVTDTTIRDLEARNVALQPSPNHRNHRVPIAIADESSSFSTFHKRLEAVAVPRPLNDSIEEIAAESYGIKLKRKVFHKWFEARQDSEAIRFVDALYQNKIMHKCFNALRQYKSQEKSSFLQVSHKEHDRVLKLYFERWYKRFYERAYRGEIFYEQLIKRKYFNLLKKYVDYKKRKLIRVMNIQEQIKRFLLIKHFKRWLEYITKRRYKDYIKDMATQHFQVRFMRTCWDQWRAQFSRRRLLRRVFSIAVENFAIRRRRLAETPLMLKSILRAWYVLCFQLTDMMKGEKEQHIKVNFGKNLLSTTKLDFTTQTR